VKILPPPRANLLKVGSFVTIIAPASLGDGKQTAVGIVVHPQVPPGWKVPSLSATPVGTNTAIETAIASETPTGTLIATESATATGTVTETATPTAGGIMDTHTPTPQGGGSAATTTSLIDWLRSLLRQLLSSS
jgi:hypothetical protein